MNDGKVLHVAKVAGISGSEAHLLALLPELVSRGWDVRFLMLHEEEPGAFEFAHQLEIGGVPVDDLRIGGDIDPAVFTRVVSYLARSRPRIVHTHLVHADVYGLLAGWLARVPLLASTKHGFNEFRERRGFAFADRNVAKLADLHIAISRGLTQYLEETEGFDAEDFQVVHYGIEAGPDPAPYTGNPARMLCVGRLIPIKGHIVLLRAFASARREQPDLELAIAGRGPLEPALREFARELGIADSVHFLGQVSPIQREMEQAGAVIVPSLGEGFGMVALEAMERGRPVVAAAIGGLAEIVVDGETGFLVSPAAPDELAAAMVRLAAEPELGQRFGRAGRQRALSAFQQRRCTEQTEQLYVDALASASS